MAAAPRLTTCHRELEQVRWSLERDRQCGLMRDWMDNIDQAKHIMEIGGLIRVRWPETGDHEFIEPAEQLDRMKYQMWKQIVFLSDAENKNPRPVVSSVDAIVALVKAMHVEAVTEIDTGTGTQTDVGTDAATQTEVIDVIAPECVICMDAPRQVAPTPCGHFCMCKRCAVALPRQLSGNRYIRHCPVCQGAWREFVQIYM